MKNKPALIIVLCSLFIISCPDPFDAANPGGGYGKAAVSIRGASMRTVFPTMSFANYEYFFAKVINGQTGEPVQKEPVDGYFILELGDWKVTVKAYAAIIDTVPTATGISAVFTVTNTHVSQAVVQLVGITGSGNGSFSYHVTYPQDAAITGFTLKNLVNETASVITISETGVSEGGVHILSGVRANVPSGQYLMNIQLRENGTAGRITGTNEVVYIYGELVSEYAIGFTGEDFSHIHDWTAWTETAVPNCSARGVDTRTCSRNSSTLHYDQKAGAAIVPDAHSYGAWKPDEGDAATVTDDGHETKTCIHNNTHIVNRIARATGTLGLAYELIATGNNANTFRVRKGTVSSGVVYIPVYHLDTVSDEYRFLTEIGSSSEYNGAFESSYNITSVTILTSIDIPSNIKSIGQYGFASCSNLTSVTIPDSVTSISSSAFSSCSKLTDINIPNNVTSIGSSAFSSCSSLPAITIPASVTSIGSSAFSRCSSLTSITVDTNNNNFTSDDGILYNKDKTTLIAYPSASGEVDNIPNSVTSIGSSAFYYCTGLTGIDIPSTVTSIGGSAFYYCSGLTSIDISSVTSIGTNAFYHCTGLTSIDIPSTVTSIGSYAFQSCTGLTSVTIPDSVTSISSSVFEDCSNLTSVTIPSTATSIGSSAFSSTGLTSVTIPAGVTSIGSQAFYGTSLTSVTIPAGVTTIGSQAFSNCKSLTSITVDADNSNFISDNGILYNKAQTTLVAVPAGKSGSITNIPSTVTSIGNSAFYYCENITSVTIPSGVTSIGGSAFYYCTGLTSVNIPSGVTSIGSSAFYRCTSITSITIPSGVTSVGDTAFYYWTSSQTINVQGKTLAQADAAWNGNSEYNNWRGNCSAVINYNYLGT